METVIKRFEELTADEMYDILKLRVDVFVVEQNCPYPEIDGKDRSGFHIYLHEDGRIAAYLRALEPGVSFKEASLGRVITAPEFRRTGLGSVLLKEGIRIVREKMDSPGIRIEAQVYARKFYELQGFVQTSDEFLEDGIPHIEMYLEF